MKNILKKYIPEHSVDAVFELIRSNNIHLKIVNERNTRHGDYRKMPNGTHQITVNVNLNKYRFLMTLIHEIAHLVAFQKYGRNIKPHGIEWKHTFRLLMLPFIRPSVFPEPLIRLMAQHFKNPTASSDTDAILSMAMKQYDEKNNEKIFVNNLPVGAYFKFRGRTFQKGRLKIKRFECVDIHSGQLFGFKPNAEVEEIIV